MGAFGGAPAPILKPVTFRSGACVVTRNAPMPMPEIDSARIGNSDALRTLWGLLDDVIERPCGANVRYTVWAPRTTPLVSGSFSTEDSVRGWAIRRGVIYSTPAYWVIEFAVVRVMTNDDRRAESRRKTEAWCAANRALIHVSDPRVEAVFVEMTAKNAVYTDIANPYDKRVEAMRLYAIRPDACLVTRDGEVVRIDANTRVRAYTNGFVDVDDHTFHTDDAFVNPEVLERVRPHLIFVPHGKVWGNIGDYFNTEYFEE